MAPATKITGGIAMAVAEIAVQGLNAAQALDYFKQHTPRFYALLVGPEVAFLMLAVAIPSIVFGIWELRKERQSKSISAGTSPPTDIHGNQNVVIQGSSNTVIGTQNYYATPERKPKARVLRQGAGFVLENRGPRLFDLHLKSAPIGKTYVLWEPSPIQTLPEGATLPLKFRLLHQNGVEFDMDMGIMLGAANHEAVIVGINSQDDNRQRWDGAGALIYKDGVWTSTGFDEMVPILCGRDSDGRDC